MLADGDACTIGSTSDEIFDVIKVSNEIRFVAVQLFYEERSVIG
ncbi:hypothetical protein YTPLAS72_28470 [Nitrospira sp.]|nr:hypothetical protein YTPLAS72_28470 [Nitrospira sp.]